jgi:hypothetical protein
MAAFERHQEPPQARVKFWATVRFALGLTQMTGAVVSLYLLLQYGMNEVSLSAVVLTCLCTTVSVLLFGRRDKRRD